MSLFSKASEMVDRSRYWGSHVIDNVDGQDNKVNGVFTYELLKLMAGQTLQFCEYRKFYQTIPGDGCVAGMWYWSQTPDREVIASGTVMKIIDIQNREKMAHTGERLRYSFVASVLYPVRMANSQVEAEYNSTEIGKNSDLLNLYKSFAWNKDATIDVAPMSDFEVLFYNLTNVNFPPENIQALVRLNTRKADNWVKATVTQITDTQ